MRNVRRSAHDLRCDRARSDDIFVVISCARLRVRHCYFYRRTSAAAEDVDYEHRLARDGVVLQRLRPVGLLPNGQRHGQGRQRGMSK